MNKDFKLFSDLENKVYIFIGAYGSGKSEIALNFAINLFDNNKKMKFEKNVAIADLDIINPFYRSSDAKITLKKHGIKLISSIFANTNAEVPAVPAEAYSIFDDDSYLGVLDIGGEDMGARVVASMKDKIQNVSYKIFMVVNLNRPYTDTKDKIIEMTNQLESSCSLPVDGYINNTNLLDESTPKELLESNNILKEVTKSNNIPLLFCSGLDDLFPRDWGNRAPDDVLFFRIKRNILYER